MYYSNLTLALFLSIALLTTGCRGKNKTAPPDPKNIFVPHPPKEPKASAGQADSEARVAKQARNLAARQREEVQAWRAYIEKRTVASKEKAKEKRLEAKDKQEERFDAEYKFKKLAEALLGQMPSPDQLNLLNKKQLDFVSIYTSLYKQLSHQVDEDAWSELVKKINSMQGSEKEQKLELLTVFVGRLEEAAAAAESVAEALEQ